jgi:hypothetical protein
MAGVKLGLASLIAVACLMMLAGACSNPTPPSAVPVPAGPQTPAPQPVVPFPPGHLPFQTPPAIWTVSGLIVDETTSGPRPVADAFVNIWMEVNGGANGYHAGHPRTDSAGHFSLSGVPVGTALIFAAGSGYRQPCAAVFDVNGDTTHNVFLVSDPSLVGSTLPGGMDTLPILTGVVYESTPNGRVPVEGASIEVEAIMDLVTATTLSDADGRYQVCGLPGATKGFWPSFDVYASKDGYGLTDAVASLNGTVTTLDIELRRTTSSTAALPRKRIRTAADPKDSARPRVPLAQNDRRNPN